MSATRSRVLLITAVCSMLAPCAFPASAQGELEPEMVRVGDFYIGRYEVTQGQWRTIMKNNPSKFARGADFPVESVSAIEVQEYIDKLNDITGKRYRLPNEAEWTLACHGSEPPATYCGGENLDELAWYDDNSNGSTHPVGTKRPNSLGIYDLNGNVYEWTSDEHEEGGRVVRGGNYSSGPGSTRLGRYNVTDYARSHWYGFRLAMDAP